MRRSMTGRSPVFGPTGAATPSPGSETPPVRYLPSCGQGPKAWPLKLRSHGQGSDLLNGSGAAHHCGGRSSSVPGPSGFGVAFVPSPMQSLNFRGVAYLEVSDPIPLMEMKLLWRADCVSAPVRNYIECLELDHPAPVAVEVRR